MSATTPVAMTDLTPEEPERPVAVVRQISLLRRVLRRPVGAAALLILAAIVICCAAAPLIAPHKPEAGNFLVERAGPSLHHLLGTDELGRDIFSRLLYGGRPTLLAAALATAIAIVLGTTLGVIAGYRRGIADRAISVWAEVLLTMPLLVVLIVVVSVFPHSLYPAMIPLGLILSAPSIRVLRGITLSVREDLYVEAARVNGLTHRQIMVRHVIPRIRGAIVVQATLVASVAVIMTSSLAFLGFGVQVPNPSWGSMIAEAASQYQQDAWFLVPTGGAVALTVLCLGLLGDALRDATAEQWIGAPPRRRRRRRARAASSAGDPPASTPPAGTPVASTAASDAPAGTPVASTAARDAPADAVLSVRDLRVTAPAADGDELTLVDGMSFDLRPGRTLAIVGESGCGKSVTARALLGVAPAGGAIHGSVRFDGTELVNARSGILRAIRGRRISFIGQDPIAALDPTQTMGGGLSELLRAYHGCGRAEARRRALELLRRVALDPERVAGLYPHQVSGGMAQRVVIARALAGDPQVLIADEPTTALDVTVQAGILALLRSLQLDAGISVLLITHDWGVVAGLADDVLVMYAGQAVEDAVAETVFARPRHPYTDGLLRCDPHRATSGAELPAIAGAVPTPAEWPTGCRFASRCPLRDEACVAQPIPLVATEAQHESRCIHVDRLVAAP